MPEQQDPQNIDEELLDQILEQLIPEAREIIDHLNLCLIQLDQDAQDEALIETVKRGFHTLKGSSGFAGLDQLSRIAKAFELFMGEVKKGKQPITAAAVGLMYEGLDAIGMIIDKAEAKDFSPIEADDLPAKLEGLKTGRPAAPPDADDARSAVQSPEYDELLNIYREGYHQLAALKHLMFSSIHLSDPVTLAVMISRQVQAHLKPARNSLWLVEADDTINEIARNGKFVSPDVRNVLRSADSEVLQRVMHEQLMVWPMDDPVINDALGEYQSPVILPIKMKTSMLGLLIIDPEEKGELELYQFITQFAAMMLSMARLHQQVDEQRTALDDMTGILFKQNAQLSALCHVEMNLLQEKDPVGLCRMVAEALVAELEAERAASFLYDPIREEFICTAQNGGFEDVVGRRYPLNAIQALQQGLQTGRLIAHLEYEGTLCIGPNQLDHWIALGIKGRATIHGVMVVEIGDADISDAISIITNYLGVLLDTILLPQPTRPV